MSSRLITMAFTVTATSSSIKVKPPGVFAQEETVMQRVT
jgi:hypothetical protein